MKLELSHHERDSDGAWKSVKPLVFVLDEMVDDEAEKEVKKEKKNKKRKTSITAKNFGASMSLSALKSAENLVLAWRCRWLRLQHDQREFFQICVFLINFQNVSHPQRFFRKI